jgi:glycosyltransferase involved in cell wall biosynthesis
MTPPSCTVVVCTRHRAGLLARCLESLACLDHPNYEVIVVDNTSGERRVEELAASFGARYVVERQVGLSRARNTGGRAALGEFVAYIDDDAVAESAWLSRHAAGFGDASVAATTGRILPTSLDTPSARAYAAAGGEDLGEDSFQVDRMSPGWFEMANFGGLGVGPNMAFRRALFEADWGFRESLGLGAQLPGNEEHYAFFTLIRDGHAIAYLPDAIVRHDYPATMDALRRRRSRILRSGVAYTAMLLIEEPQFRSNTFRYMREAMQGTRRTWRRGRAEQRFVTRLQLFAAACAGLPLYLRTALAGRRVFMPRSVRRTRDESELRRPSAPN